MNIIKNFFKGLAAKLKGLINKEKFVEIYIKTKEWTLSLNAVKITAIIVVNCFLLTGVYGQAVAGLLENNRATEQFKQVFEDFNLPYSYGKITSANYQASDTVVINIQDLHSHAEVQRNINNIISLFDDKYGVKSVYIEGAYGQVSTKWLTASKDENIKNSVMNRLLDSGRLTGAEYYSASKGKTEIIKGLENKEVYFDNLKRFGTLIDNQEVITLHIDSIKDTVKNLQEQYYNRQQKKIEELSAGYVSGNIEANKYFTLMKKHAEKLAVDIENYPNLSMYITLLERQKEINYQRTTQELQAFVIKLKENLPYNAYKILLSETKNFSQMDKLYGYMIKLSRQYNLDLSQNFKELEKFFAYIELSQAINPLELIKEEQNFKDEINDRFSENKAEEEVVFLSNFVRYYQDYLLGKITADDCNYYNANIDRFKNVWVKYIDNRELVALEDYEQISDKFYKINFERNQYFLDNMKEVLDSKKIEGVVEGKDELQKTMNSLQQAKEVYITVTGGFHTQEMSAMLAKAGITNIVITPNVTGDTKIAEETYYKIAQEQAKISFQALAALPTSEMIKLISGEEIKTDSVREPLQDILKQLEILSESDINEFFKTSTEGKVSYREGLLSVKVGNSVITYDAKAEKWLDISEGPTGMEKSERTIKSTISAAWKLTAYSVIASVFLFAAPLTGGLALLPIVPMISALYGGLSLGTQYYMKNQIAKNAIEESDAEPNETINNFLRDNFGDIDEKLLTDISDRLDASTVARTEEQDGKRLIHLNYSMLNKMFVNKETGSIKNEALLRTIIKHEIRHINHPNMSENNVGLIDTISFVTDFIASSVKNSVILNNIRNFVFTRAPSAVKGKVKSLSVSIRVRDRKISKLINEYSYDKPLSDELVSALAEMSKLDENLIRIFLENGREKYREQFNILQAYAQIKTAGFISQFENVHLGTGGGKTEAGQLALVQILMNQARGEFDITKSCGLYMTKESQLIGDCEGFFNFLNSPEIKPLLLDSDVDGELVVFFVNHFC